MLLLVLLCVVDTLIDKFSLFDTDLNGSSSLAKIVVFGDGVSTLLIKDGNFNLGVLECALCDSGGLNRDAILNQFNFLVLYVKGGRVN